MLVCSVLIKIKLVKYILQQIISHKIPLKYVFLILSFQSKYELQFTLAIYNRSRSVVSDS